MRDWSELKRLAERVEELCADDNFDSDMLDDAIERMDAKSGSTVILSLIAENERLRAGVKGDFDLDAWLDWSKEAENLSAEVEALRKDAERWRAFINCARIKFFGWAGYSNPDPNGNDPKSYRHFGAEFWTIHQAPTSDKEQAHKILNGFADAAIDAAMSKGSKGDES